MKFEVELNKDKDLGWRELREEKIPITIARTLSSTLGETRRRLNSTGSVLWRFAWKMQLN
jgi:hypothetical protein